MSLENWLPKFISHNECFSSVFGSGYNLTRKDKMKRYYKGQDRDVFRTLWQKDFYLQDTSSVYFRSAQQIVPWIGHQRRQV